RDRRGAAPKLGAAPLSSYAGVRTSAFRRKARLREAPLGGVPGGSPTRKKAGHGRAARLRRRSP
ncbi:hypothetical protein, partial [Streptomyces olivaceus]|uniref:hypothetical protein n=1 Tax=Streptomyces olivaceus TaxID=47716 RepID=UPI0036392557